MSRRTNKATETEYPDIGSWEEMEVEIVNSLNRVIHEMADDSAAGGWSTHENDYEIHVAEFGDSIAVDGDIFVSQYWRGKIGLPPGVQSWSDVGTAKLDEWLEDNGWMATDRGGRVPTTEEEVTVEHAIRAVEGEIDAPEGAVQKIADEKGYGELAYVSSKGRTTVWEMPRWER